MKTRLCKICNKPIDFSIRSSRSVTCSDACLLKTKSIRAVKTKACLRCGKLFEYKSKKAKFCSKKCTALARFDAGIDRVPKRCSVCGKLFRSRIYSSNTLCQECYRNKDRARQSKIEQVQKKFERQESITCQICGNVFISGEITSSHLGKHGITVAQYKQRFGEDSLWSATRRKIKFEQLNRARQKRAKPEVTRTCAFCGKPLSPTQDARVNTCSAACGYALQKQKTAGRVRKCKVCGKFIDFGVRDRRATTCSVECERAAIGMRKPKLLVCQACGKVFESLVANARGCSPACQSKLRQLKQGRVVKICSKCGREFLSTSESNDLCKKCFLSPESKPERVIDDPIECKICHKIFKGVITNSHLKMHNVSPEDYRKQFGATSLTTAKMRATMHSINPQFDDAHIKAREEALRKYEELQPKCTFCHKPLPLKKFMQYYSQKKPGNNWEDKPRFCSTKCRGSYYISDEFRKIAPHKYLRPRSKGEKAVEQWLRTNFPTLELITNDRTQLKPYELDIYIPQYRIGIEYEGPLHYEPIFGEKRFYKTVETDAKKVALASKKGITLIIIDSRIKSFDEQIAPLKAALASVLSPS